MCSSAKAAQGCSWRGLYVGRVADEINEVADNITGRLRGQETQSRRERAALECCRGEGGEIGSDGKVALYA